MQVEQQRKSALVAVDIPHARSVPKNAPAFRDMPLRITGALADFPVVTEHPAFDARFRDLRGQPSLRAALETILVRVQSDAHER